jgi:glycosyltransferase involved in cell wall biosynthesis/intein/homing endonuclease
MKQSNPKILWVGDAGCSTGFARVSHAVLDRLHDVGYDIGVLAINFNGFPTRRRSYRMYPPRMTDPLGVDRLAQVYAQENPDAVVLFQDFWNVAGYIEKVPNLPGLVTYFPVDAPNVKETWLTYLAKAAVVATYTDFAAAEVAASFDRALTKIRLAARESGRNTLTGIKTKTSDGQLFEVPFYRIKQLADKKHVHVIPHGVDTSTFFEIPINEARQQLQLPESAFIVLNVNRNQPRKRLDLTIRGFAEFAKDKKDALLVLHCWGASPVEWDLPQLAGYYGVADKVVFLHEIFPHLTDEQLNLLYNTADVVINTCGGEGWGLCLGPSTLIETALGPKEIRDVRPGEIVLTASGNYSEVLATTQRTVDQWYRVKVVGQEPIDVTPEHPFLAICGKNLFDDPVASSEWTPVGELCPGDFVALGVDRTTMPSQLPIVDLAGLLDDSWHKDERMVWHPMGFSGNCEVSISTVMRDLGETKKIVEKGLAVLKRQRHAVSERVLRAAKYWASTGVSRPKEYPRYIELTPDLLWVIGWYMAEGSQDRSSVEFSMGADEQYEAQKIAEILKSVFEVDSRISVVGNRLRLHANGHPVARFFDLMCGSGAHNKRVTPIIPLTYKHILSLWRGYAEGDGYRNPAGAISVTTVSRILAHQMRMSLRSFGIPTGVTITDDDFTVTLGVEGSYRLLGLTPPEGHRSQRHVVWNEDHPWARVESIEEITGTLEVYDLAIAGTHSFVGNGVVVHNTAFEAAAVGKPLIQPDWSATGEIWKGAALLTPVISVYHELQGINTCQGSVCTQAFADQLTSLYESRDLRISVGDACRAVTQRPEYQWDAIAKTFDKLIRYAMEKGVLVPRSEPV